MRSQFSGLAARVFALFVAPLWLSACADSNVLEGEIELTSLFAAEFDLIDHFGEPAPDERFEGKATILYFGFVSCPDVCPNSLGKLTSALDNLGNKDKRVNALFVTVDPERDTPDLLKDYLSYDERLLGLTGSEQALQEARDGLMVYAKKVPMPDSAMGYTMEHQSMFYVLDDEGTPIAAIRDDVAPAQIAAILLKYL